MTIDEAIQHCEEVMMENLEKTKDRNASDPIAINCFECADEHQQLVEWLKELKAYREQRGKRMNESEKERLTKKDIESIENRVRHAFNQGYEMGLKESSSEIPNTCGDAISRQELIEALNTWDKFGYAPTYELIPLRGSADKDKYVPYIHYDDVIECIKGMPSVSPQQRTGRWIEVLDKIRAEIAEFEEEVFHRTEDYSDYAAVRYCLEIIDKYKAESEDKE